MPVLVPPVTDERDGLLKFIAAQRNALRVSVFGLTRDQATSKPSASGLSLAGLIKHSAHCERGWVAERIAQREIPWVDYEQQFTLTDDESVEDAIALLDEVERETEAIVRALPDLDVQVPVPDAPWFPKDVEAWSARWVLLHLIEELARHAGHADIIRESIDGSNAFALMARAEGDNPEWLSMLEGKDA
ncbi:MAG: DinB family protein [Actinomycetota bacterium]